MEIVSHILGGFFGDAKKDISILMKDFGWFLREFSPLRHAFLFLKDKIGFVVPF